MTWKMNVHKTPWVGLDISNGKVKRRMGFPDLSGLLSYIFVVCNGDISLMLKRESPHTGLKNGSCTLNISGGGH